jgi:hypothetical protein
VTAGNTTAVDVDAWKFFITDLTLTPQVIPNGAAFHAALAVGTARRQLPCRREPTMDFATITSSQTATDTTLDVHTGQGSHYFRVRPVTPYAHGTGVPERFGYVTGGGNQVKVISVSTP